MKNFIKIIAVVVTALMFATGCEKFSGKNEVSNETSSNITKQQGGGTSVQYDEDVPIQAYWLAQYVKYQHLDDKTNVWVVDRVECEGDYGGNCLPEVIIIGVAKPKSSGEIFASTLPEAIAQGSSVVKKYFNDNKEELEKIFCGNLKEPKIFELLLSGEITANIVSVYNDTYFIGFYYANSPAPQKSSEYLRILPCRTK